VYLSALYDYGIKATCDTNGTIFFIISYDQSGIYWVTLVDYYAAAWGVLLIGLLEVTAISYCYGKLFYFGVLFIFASYLDM
jgi:hypothetical protein